MKNKKLILTVAFLVLVFSITSAINAQESIPVCTTFEEGHSYLITEDTILCPGTYTDVYFTIGASDIYFDCDGATIEGLNDGFGISADSQTGIDIRNCIVKNYAYGIYLYTSDSSTITNNEVHSSTENGIQLASDSQNNIVSDNTVYDNAGFGIYLQASPNNEVDNNIIYSNHHGIYMSSDADNNIVTNNEVYDNSDVGIYPYSSTGNTLSDNTIYDNNYGLLVQLNSNNNDITNNIIHDNNYGVYLYTYSTGNDVYNNKLTNNEVNAYDTVGTNTWNTEKTLGTNIVGGPYLGGNYYSDYTGEDADEDWLGDTSHTIPGDSSVDELPLLEPTCVDLTGLDEYTVTKDTKLCEGTYYMDDTEKDGALIINADNIELDCNGASIIGKDPAGLGGNPGYGIYALSRKNVIIKNCQVSKFLNYGIYLHGTSDSTLTNNIAKSNGEGIRLHSSSNNLLEKNTVNSNTFSGILFQDSSNNNLIDNTIKSNSKGINFFTTSHGNTLTSNTINSNNYGIYVDHYSSENKFTGNTITENSEAGMYICSGCHSTLVYNNYFDNTLNAHDEDGKNSWNIEKTEGENIIGGPYLGGNYYSDYTGIDTDGDGLGDTPYEIPGGSSVDELPLTSACVDLTGLDEYTVTEDTVLCPGTYLMNDMDADGAIIIGASNVELDCNGAVIEGEEIGGSKGIYANNRRYIKIHDCTVKSYGDDGIYLVRAHYSEVYNNVVENNRYGIHLQTTKYTKVTDNEAYNNRHSGIRLYSNAGENTLTNNILYENSYHGILLYSYSMDNTIKDNIAYDNGNTGIFLSTYSNKNIIQNNEFYNSMSGIELYYGVLNIITENKVHDNSLYGIYVHDSSNKNKIYNNKLEDNNVNAHSTGNNVWNLEKTEGENIVGGPYLGGNYYSDYIGEDADEDGLGDTPYEIPGDSNIDNLPLIPAEIEFVVEITSVSSDSIYAGDSITFSGTVTFEGEPFDTTLEAIVVDSEGTEISHATDIITSEGTFSWEYLTDVDMPEGEYTAEIKGTYEDLESSDTETFNIEEYEAPPTEEEEEVVIVEGGGGGAPIYRGGLLYTGTVEPSGEEEGMLTELTRIDVGSIESVSAPAGSTLHVKVPIENRGDVPLQLFLDLEETPDTWSLDSRGISIEAGDSIKAYLDVITSADDEAKDYTLSMLIFADGVGLMESKEFKLTLLSPETLILNMNKDTYRPGDRATANAKITNIGKTLMEAGEVTIDIIGPEKGIKSTTSFEVSDLAPGETLVKSVDVQLPEISLGKATASATLISGTKSYSASTIFKVGETSISLLMEKLLFAGIIVALAGIFVFKLLPRWRKEHV